MNLYSYSNEPVTAAVYRNTYDEDGNKTGSELVTPASDEVIGLVVGFRTTKSLADVQQVINNGRPQRGIDANIAAYLPSIDPAQIQADEWYEQHLIVESADPDEVITRVYTDEQGDEQVEMLPNAYKTALEARKALEATNAWLKGLRGLKSAPKRPEFTMTVEQWKADGVDYRTERFNEYVKLSPEAKFEHTVGDMLDALIKHAYGDSTELDEIAGKVSAIKTMHPKKK
jgi:hypothetical protein